MRSQDGGFRGAVLSLSSRGLLCFDVTDVPGDYRVALSPLPGGVDVLNSCFLPCDVSGRSYPGEEFKASLEGCGVFQDFSYLGDIPNESLVAHHSKNVGS